VVSAVTGLFPDLQLAGALFSEDRRYRYHLWRTWAPGPRMLFVMLNPSIANESKPDPTMTRCMGFARREGCGGLDIVNLYALVSRHRDALLVAKAPVGPDNDATVARVAAAADGPIVAGWGTWPHIPRGRIDAILAAVARPMLCLEVTKNGMPGHPLYLRGDAPLVPWRRPA
jgi:hypothetical protein